MESFYYTVTIVFYNTFLVHVKLQFQLTQARVHMKVKRYCWIE